MLTTKFTCEVCNALKTVENDGQQPAYTRTENGKKICAACSAKLNAAKLPPFTFESEAQYHVAAQMVSAYDFAAANWRKENNTNGIPTEVCATFPYGAAVTNELRSQIEVWEFLHKPIDKYFIYIDERAYTATTWMGSVLGIVNFHPPFTAKVGKNTSTRQHITVHGIDGKKYYGTYYTSSGNYARIKLSKR